MGQTWAFQKKVRREERGQHTGLEGVAIRQEKAKRVKRGECLTVRGYWSAKRLSKTITER